MAIRLIERLKACLREAVPDGTAVLVTVTAPIRLPSKTAAALEEKIGALLRRRAPRRDRKFAIHGNRIRIRISKNGPRRAPKVSVFVHNPDSDPVFILNMASESR